MKQSDCIQNNQTRDWLCIDPSPLQLVYSGGTFRICRCCRCRCPSLRRSKIREEIARPSSRKSELLRRQMTSEMGKVKMSENDIDEKLAASVVAQLAHRSLPIPEIRSSYPVMGKNVYGTCFTVKKTKNKKNE